MTPHWCRLHSDRYLIYHTVVVFHLFSRCFVLTSHLICSHFSSFYTTHKIPQNMIVVWVFLQQGSFFCEDCWAQFSDKKNHHNWFSNKKLVLLLQDIQGAHLTLKRRKIEEPDYLAPPLTPWPLPLSPFAADL